MESHENTNDHVVISDEIKVTDSDIKEEIKDVISDAPCVEFTVIHNKDKYTVSMPLSSTIKQLKEKLVNIIGVYSQMQKIMIKGLAKDDQTLDSLNINSSSRVMVVGAKFKDIVAVSIGDIIEGSYESSSSSEIEPLSKKKMHLKITEKGVPNDAIVGILNFKDSLPLSPISGLRDKNDGKLRLTFKLDIEQLWIGTKEQTKKIMMSTIKSIVSGPVDGHAEYYIMGFQLGATEASLFWVYWVPAQYVDAIKETILGKD